ncbi:MAG: aminotransferase class IV [Mucilaginibacter polytrichastri]|nr:aminotransferase class IV [Mucilaginibacter polytrichastri]
MSALVNLNGEILPVKQAHLPVSNRAFRYGDSLFETMRLMKGHLNFAAEHAARLQKGMRMLGIDGYSQMDNWFIREKVMDLARRNRCDRHARVRLTVFREGEGFYTPSQNSPGYLLEVSPLDESQFVANTKGLIVDVYDEIPKPVNALSNLKTGSALPYVLAGVFRNRKRLDEAFILNDKGNLCESISANVFVWYNDCLYTPALSEGCIAGVMRQAVIRLAIEHNIPLSEAEISPEILREADEVFLTNSVRGIQWVMGFGNKRYFNEVSRKLIEKLNAMNKSMA